MGAKLKQTLTHSWQYIQHNLFPWIEVAISKLTEKNQQLITIPEMIKLEHFIPLQKPSVGRPRCNRQAIARAFIAKAIHNLPATRLLIERLNADTQLRQLCGWEHRQLLPDEVNFSRVFAEFAKSKLTEKIHEKLICSYQSDRLIEHISRDATAISAREKPNKKPIEEVGNANPKLRRGRPKKDNPPVEKSLTRIDKQLKMPSIGEMLDDLPKSCDVGTKTTSKKNLSPFKTRVD